MSDSHMYTLPPGKWHYEHITAELVQVERVNQIIFSGKTKYQDVLIQDTGCFGRSLVLDGKTQSTELDEFVYHEALVHPSMIAHPNPKHVFVAGGGEGATIKQILSHNTISKVTMVDIDEEVVDLCHRYLPNHHQGAFNNPKLKIHFTDAMVYLETNVDTYDVVIIDVPDPLEHGPAYALFTREFYRLVASRLSPGGIMVAQAGPTGPAFYQQCFSAVAATMASVFPKIYLSEAFIPSFGTTWGFIIGSSRTTNIDICVQEEINRKIRTRINGELKYYDGITHKGMFSIPKYLRHAVTEETRIITKDEPLFTQ